MEAAELCNYEPWKGEISINAICFTNTVSEKAHPWVFYIAFVIKILLSYTLLWVYEENEDTFSGPLTLVSSPKINRLSDCTWPST